MRKSPPSARNWTASSPTCSPHSASPFPPNWRSGRPQPTRHDIEARARQAHREASRRATSSLELDDIVHGNRHGPLPLRWVYRHVLRELAQHCRHADIPRSRLLNE
ncbi:DUF664 domain-containing protein [Actinophytocola sp.]|uniref:mycothiol transferase n=1 Tax=Actinophytocola sp. TaxID=1872138 RepID=UPI002ED098BD